MSGAHISGSVWEVGGGGGYMGLMTNIVCHLPVMFGAHIGVCGEKWVGGGGYIGLIREWSLITRKADYKIGKSRVRNFLSPPSPRDRVKRFPLLPPF